MSHPSETYPLTVLKSTRHTAAAVFLYRAADKQKSETIASQKGLYGQKIFLKILKKRLTNDKSYVILKQ